MSSELPFKPLLRFLLCAAFLAAISMISAGCGNDEEPAPDATVGGEAPAPEGAPGAAPLHPTAPPDVPMGDVVPETLSVLQYLPAGAQVAVAVPPVQGLIDDYLPLIQVLAPAEADPELQLAAFFAELGEDMGVEADNYEALAGALGLDPASPMAVFADFTRTIESAAAAKAADDARKAAEAAPAESAAGVEGGDGAAAADDTPPAGEGAAPDEGGLAPPEATVEFEADYMADAEPPTWVAVFGLADRDKAVAEVERLAGEHEAIAGAEKASEEVAGQTITTRGEYGYFTTGTHLLLGSLDLLRGAAERVKTPATLRYGTVQCLASEPDEVVALVYGGRFFPAMKQALSLFAPDDPTLALARQQIATYEGMFIAGDEDPVVTTIGRGESQIELLSRLDSSTHPGLLKTTGSAQPLRLARYLPESTLALISMRFSDEMKAQFMNEIMPAVNATGNADAAMQAAYMNQFLTQLGDEVTIGISGGQGGLPELYVLLGLAEPEATKGVLQMFVPMEAAMEHEGATIQSISTPIGMNIFLSFVDNFAVASNSDAGIRDVISQHKAGATSKFFAGLNPPFEIDVPRYQAAIIKSDIVGSLAATASMFSPEVPDTTELDPILTAVRELRASQDLVDGWIVGRVTVYLGDLERAAEMRAAISAGADPNQETGLPATLEDAPAPLEEPSAPVPQ